MSLTINFATQNVPDGKCLPCSGISGRAVSLSPCPFPGDYKTFSQIKIASLKCSSRGMSSVCRAGSDGYKRNPDFSRQNKQKFTRRRNRQNEEKDGSENLEEPELFPSKNGTLLSASSATPKFQATATPGPREKEIVELFRRVQAQLRAKAALKKEEKIEEAQGRGKESDSVDSLLKLIRKHTTQQGNSSSGSTRDLILDQPESNETFEEEKNTTFFDSNNYEKDEAPGRESPSFSRPVSKFQRRSPVPQIKFPPTNSDFVTDTWVNGKSGRIHAEPGIIEPKIEIEPEPRISVKNVFGDEGSDIDEGYGDEDEDADVEAEEERPTIVIDDLSGMKLQELRALAKSRGIKGISRLKKGQLMELLAGGST